MSGMAGKEGANMTHREQTSQLLWLLSVKSQTLRHCVNSAAAHNWAQADINPGDIKTANSSF